MYIKELIMNEGKRSYLCYVGEQWQKASILQKEAVYDTGNTHFHLCDGQGEKRGFYYDK